MKIELEYISGETNYIAPPLPKGEILNGIAGFLEKTSVKKRPRALDLYGPYKNQEELEENLLSGLKSTARVPKTARSERKVSDVPSVGMSVETETEDDTTSYEGVLDGEEEKEEEQVPSVAFDVQCLPMAYGTKTTEVLIDSLFNPVRVTDKMEESPFTIYEPVVEGVDFAFLTPKGRAGTRQGQGPVQARVQGLGLTLSDQSPSVLYTKKLRSVFRNDKI